MTKDEALKLGLEALEVANSCVDGYYIPKGKTHLPEIELAITAIKEALAEQEPVAWISPKELLVMRGNAYAGAKDWRVNVGLESEEGDVGLYTTPPQRTWLGLTLDEQGDLYSEYSENPALLYRAIEAALKAKNT
jgi:hypothetical protein